MTKNIRIKIKEIEDIRYAKSVLTKSELEFLNTYYEFECDDNTTIRDILKFYINGLEEYYLETGSKNDLYTDNFMKHTFELFYNENVVRIFDLDTPIIEIKKDDLELKFLIGVGGGFDALEKTKGINYWMNTRENGKHNLPHIHVKYNDEEVIIGILNGEILAGKIQKKKQNEAVERIKNNKNHLLFLWKTRTDGQKFDINPNDLYLDI